MVRDFWDTLYLESLYKALKTNKAENNKIILKQEVFLFSYKPWS